MAPKTAKRERPSGDLYGQVGEAVRTRNAELYRRLCRRAARELRAEIRKERQA